MRNYSVDRIANPAPSERIRRVSVRTISSFIDISEEQREKSPKPHPYKASTERVETRCTLISSQITQSQLQFVRITRIVLRTTQTRLRLAT